jgi:hypothetical protein
MPMDRKDFRAMQSKLQMTNYPRHLKQADKSAARVGVTVAGVVLVFSHGGEDEVHYFGVPWVDDEVAKDIRQAVHGQLGEMIALEDSAASGEQKNEEEKPSHEKVAREVE